MCEQIGISEVPKISSQFSVDTIKIVPQVHISQGMCEQIGVIEVLNISSQEQILQRTVEQILGEFCVPRGRGIAKSDDFIQELDALFNQDAMPLAWSEVRQGSGGEGVAWSDAFLRDRLRLRNSWFLLWHERVR